MISDLKDKPKKYPAFIIMAIVIILDQVTKILTRAFTLEGHSYPVLQNIFGDTFRFTHLRNTGAAFSISLSNPAWNRVFFVSATVLAVAFVLYLLRHATNRIQVIAFGLVLGGAIGNNLIDRLFFGAVTDFIDVDFPNIFGLERWPVFNVADSAIFCAMILLIIDMLFIKSTPVQEVPPNEINTKEL